MLRTRLHGPGLECDNCLKFMAEHGKRPRCKVSGDCPIQDIAATHDYDRVVRQAGDFIRMKGFSQIPGYEKIIQRILEESKLEELPLEELMEMEVLWSEYQESRRESNKK